MKNKFPLFSKLFNTWKDEFFQGTRYGLKGKKVIEKNSKFQIVTIFESLDYCKALLLDDCWMTAEFQEKQYHECIVHPALSTCKEINNVLIVWRCSNTSPLIDENII